ncbi:MAG: YggS family pyridoxal phosphate-dependent enzyme [Actinomycetaceae bacterium]|nr:YggS family pyridoxal phosphate-dependent enzyme [Actinomycetaceae bacterium]
MTPEPQELEIFAAVERAAKQVAEACHEVGRDPGEVEIELAVKTRSAQECFVAGKALNAVGRPALLAHNRVQEAQAMESEMALWAGAGQASLEGFQMSLIGPLQRNKINHALRCFQQVESVDSLRLATALDKRVQRGWEDSSQRAGAADTPSEANSSQRRPLPVFLQVNTSAEPTKSGVEPGEALQVATQISQLQGLELVGFMTIGANTTDGEVVKQSFLRLRNIRDQAVKIPELTSARQLSMGMSGDFPLAIACGATRIRLGSVIFGARPRP